MSVNPKALPFNLRIAGLKTSLSFGETAHALGLKGSAANGWKCPHCHAPSALKARGGDQGGRCRACEKGFDILTLVTEARRVSPTGGLGVLETILSDKQNAETQQSQGGLFDTISETEREAANGR